MVELDCHRCGQHIDDGEHWINITVFHHDRKGNPEDRSRNDPQNDGINLCPACYDDVSEVLYTYEWD